MQFLLAAAVPRTVVCALLFSGVAAHVLAAPFEIRHDTAYARMDLPITVGTPTELTWSLAEEYMSFFVGERSLEVVSFVGSARTGPLRSVDAQWNSDGSLGQAAYLFGKGDIAFELVLRLEDGTLHTMRLLGDTSRMHVAADEDGGDMGMSVPHAKIDRQSVRVLGVGRQVTGILPYFLDVAPDGDQGDRVAAAFGSIYFEDAPTPEATRLAASAAPEPASVALVAMGLVGLTVRRRGRRSPGHNPSPRTISARE